MDCEEQSGIFLIGLRYATLYRIARLMRRLGMSPREIKDSLHVLNRNHCRPTLYHEEIQQIAAMAARHPGGETVEDSETY